MLKIGFIKAETHSAEYLLHKYWARKPHNVVSHFIKELLPNGGLVLDPFCGSGVSLRESSLIGCGAVGIDINPIACLISKVLVSPPLTKDFEQFVLPILEKIQNETDNSFLTQDKKIIKYAIHSIVVKCKCGYELTKDEANNKGKMVACPKCGNKLVFNLENLYQTRIKGYVCEKAIEMNEREIAQQTMNSADTPYNDDIAPYNFTVDTNRRILAFCGMTTQSFFTKRNFSILVHLAEVISQIPNEKVRDAALLLLTASAAQCSRLIPTRNNLSTGGPAWSVPGFWVPNEHLETNPIVHLLARYKKFVRGLTVLSKHQAKGTVEVLNDDSINYLKRTEKKFDLVFLDPPYGESVPYTEFSIIWNSFLKNKPDSNLDISVSDRLNKNESWQRYGKQIDALFFEISKKLNHQGKVVITFNNNDIRAWSALLQGLQNNGFACCFAVYQIPAVISSKAQFAQDNSYISDIYSVYEQSEKAATKDLSIITEQLIYAANVRGGKITKSLARRIALVNWLRYNICANLLQEIDNIIEALFSESDKPSELILKPNYRAAVETESLKEKCCEIANKILKDGPQSFAVLHEKICNEMYDVGMPDPQEVRGFLSSFPANKTSYLSGLNHSEQQGFHQLGFFENE